MSSTFSLTSHSGHPQRVASIGSFNPLVLSSDRVSLFPAVPGICLIQPFTRDLITAPSRKSASATRNSPARIRNTGGTNCAAPKIRFSMDIYFLYSQSFAKKKNKKQKRTESLHAHASISHMLERHKKSRGARSKRLPALLKLRDQLGRRGVTRAKSKITAVNPYPISIGSVRRIAKGNPTRTSYL